MCLPLPVEGGSERERCFDETLKSIGLHFPLKSESFLLWTAHFGTNTDVEGTVSG
jgi:hypothetical protein